jgi:putative addiction module component (TIGR02574 family)
MSVDLNAVFSLSLSEKIQLVEDLWDDIAASTETIPLSESQKEQLAHARENLRKHPESGMSWEAVKRSILERHGR